MKVLQIIRAPLGGAFRHVCDISAGCNDDEIKFGIITDTAGKYPPLTGPIDGYFKFGIFEVEMTRNPSFKDVEAIIRIIDIVKEVKPDIIHGHGAKGGFYARIIARYMKVKCVYTTHGGSLHYDHDSIRGKLYHTIEMFLDRITHGVVFESHWVKHEYMLNVCKPRGINTTIPHGVKEIIPIQIPQEYDLVYLGELRYIKGLDILLTALAEIKCENELELSLGVYGTGVDELYLKKLAADLNLSSSVSFKGYSENPLNDLSRGGCVVIPSRRESFCYTALEAACLEKPVIASRTGVMPELFVESVNSVLFPPGSVVELKARILERMNSTNGDHQCIQKEAVCIRKEYSIERMSLEIQKFYCDVLSTG